MGMEISSPKIASFISFDCNKFFKISIAFQKVFPVALVIGVHLPQSLDILIAGFRILK